MPNCTETERKYLDNLSKRELLYAVQLERVSPEYIAEGIRLNKAKLDADIAWNLFWNKCPIPHHEGKDSAWGKLWYAIQDGSKAEKEKLRQTPATPDPPPRSYYFDK